MSKKKSDTELVQLRLSNSMIDGIDLAIKIGLGNNRTDVIKMAIGNLLIKSTLITEMKKRKLE